MNNRISDIQIAGNRKQCNKRIIDMAKEACKKQGGMSEIDRNYVLVDKRIFSVRMK